MNQQQLNKIDEELDGFFSSKYFNVEKWKYSSYVAQFKDFLHSKLQEAYELGCQDTKDAALKLIKEYYSTNDYGDSVIENADMLLLDIKSEL